MATVWQEIATSDSSQTFTNKTLTSPVLNAGVSGTAIKDEDNMVSDSATHLATQQSIKKYVDDQVDTADAISELADTTIATLTTGEFLQYTGNAWENRTKAEATIASSGANIDITSLARVNSVEPGDASGADQAGTDFIIQGGAGTGDGAGGEVLIKVCTSGDSGSSVNAAVTAVTIAEDKTVTFAGDLIVNGTTTTINTSELSVDDKNIVLASIADGSSPAPSVTTGDGAGITVKVAADADASDFPDLTWKKAMGGGNANGTGTAVGLTGWRVQNSRTSNFAAHALAIMDFDTSTGAPANTVTSAGIGSFILNTADDKLYVRVSDA